MNHVELFAGIGGFRQALTLLQNDFGIHQKTVAFSEIDESAVRTYKSAFDTMYSFFLWQNGVYLS